MNNDDNETRTARPSGVILRSMPGTGPVELIMAYRPLEVH